MEDSREYGYRNLWKRPFGLCQSHKQGRENRPRGPIGDVIATAAVTGNPGVGRRDAGHSVAPKPLQHLWHSNRTGADVDFLLGHLMGSGISRSSTTVGYVTLRPIYQKPECPRGPIQTPNRRDRREAWETRRGKPCGRRVREVLMGGLTHSWDRNDERTNPRSPFLDLRICPKTETALFSGHHELFANG